MSSNTPADKAKGGTVQGEGRSHSKGEAPGDLDTRKNRPQR